MHSRAHTPSTHYHITFVSLLSCIVGEGSDCDVGIIRVEDPQIDFAATPFLQQLYPHRRAQQLFLG